MRQLRGELGTEHGTVKRVAEQLGYGVESVRTWVQAGRRRRRGRRPGRSRAGREADQGAGAGEPRVASGERDLEVGVGFLRGGARPPTEVIVEFIDEHRDEFGVEPICKDAADGSVHLLRGQAPRAEPSARASRDAVMMPVLMALWVANRKVYGAHKLWKAARRAGHDIGRDQVARLMRELGIEGVTRRRKKVFTTRRGPRRGAGTGPGRTGTSPPTGPTRCGSPT